jgi:hypothetical protein
MPNPFRKKNPAPAPRDNPPPSGSSSGPFTTGYPFGPSEVVTNIKLGDQVDEMVVDYAALAQALLNSGASDPSALVRFSNSMLQLRNADTGLWHSIWIAGAVGAETLKIGPGVN